MKTRQTGGEYDSARLAVLLGVLVGLGIAVHEGFFLVAAVTAVGAMAGALAHAIHEHSRQARLAYRAR